MSLFWQIGLLVIGLATLAFIFRLLRQPLLPVYLLAGFLLGPVLHLVPETQVSTLESFSLIGIAFLLFVAGIELDLSILRRNFKLALIGALFAFLQAFFFLLLFAHLPALSVFGSYRYVLAIAFSFTSTLLVVKTLSETNRLATTLGYLALATLLAQDFFAILLIALLQQKAVSLQTHLTGVVVLSLLAFLGGRFFFPAIFRWAAFSEELLFLLSLAVMFLFAIISDYFGLSLAVGAFLGGLSISSLLYRYEIVSKIQPLRDFFLMLLFLTLGLQIKLSAFQELLLPFLVLLGISVLLKPFLYTLLGLGMRLSRPLAVQNGFLMAPSSEFSLVLTHNVSPVAFSLAGYVFLASSFLASYFFEYLNSLSLVAVRILDWLIPIRLYRRHIQDRQLKELKDHVVIFGGHRMGSRLIRTLRRLKKKVVLVDHNPDVISRFRNKVIAIYGDAMEPEIRKKAGLDKASVVISTIPDLKVNLSLLREINQKNPQAFVYLVASDYPDALKLYDEGADFVILPHFLGAEQADILLQNFDQALERLAKIKEEHWRKIAKEAKFK
ncbi:cation:proton antiporter [bacterium]|nr:cation:proton antiporter [bacterium]